MSNDDELNFIPSILNPRTFRNTGNTLTQIFIFTGRWQYSQSRRCHSTKEEEEIKRSTITRRSLSLKRNNSSVFCNNSTNISISKKKECNNLSALQKKNVINQIEKEIVKNTQNLISMNKSTAFTDCLFYNNVKDDAKLSKKNRCTDGSLGSSAIKDFVTLPKNSVSSQISIDKELEMNKIVDENDLILTLSSATELNNDLDVSSDQTILYDNEKPTISVSFGVSNCNTVDLNTKKSNFKKVLVSCENNNITVDCDVVESSQMSEESAFDENMNKILNNPQKRSAVAVNLEVKKKKLSDKEENKVLILNTNAIGKLSHVIIQQPSYNLDKRKKFESKLENSGRKSVYSNNGLCKSVSLKQDTLDSYFSSSSNVPILSELTTLNKSHNVSSNSHFCQGVKTRNDNQDMSKNLSADIKNERAGKLFKGIRKDEMSPKSAKVSSRRGSESPRLQASSSDAPRALSPRGKNDTASSHSPRKNVESLQFNLPCKTRSNKSSVATKNIPHYKIVAGTHFAVDAFSYGDIPNVKHYFLTHFHSDHYSGLKKSFNKLLFCSKITADLCTSRLGVNPKCIHIINLDETMRVEGVEVTAIDANHCPGAVMLVFTLPSNKTILHTGDFRATPIMESYPIFWNKDIHTIYLDTTYCNPRYDFPTQEQSLEMALYLLRQKKLLLEKAGKKFSSVLIVCGTYTIGKEKFFLGMARRVGCAVWACPEKDRVLQAVEGRSFGQAPPHECQLHVVPMRDLTHEKLRSYLDSLQGAFSEVVAFKPSGWENGKNTTSEENMITIHGIPYSEHSSFSEMIRFVKFLKPKQVVPTVDISGGIKSVQKHFPCPLILKEDIQYQSKVTDFFSIQNRQQMSAVT